MTRSPAPVSALMAAYNAEQSVGEAIQSIQAQTLPVAEIIVVADGSSDATAEIARSMGVRVSAEQTRGLAAARNKCVQWSAQPWLAFLDSDDTWEPDKIERQMELAVRYPELALITCDYSILNGTGFVLSAIEKHRPGYESQSKRSAEGGAIIDRLDPSFADITYFLLCSNVMFRRDFLDTTGWFDESLHSADDFDCFMRLLANHPMGVVEKALVKRWEHQNGASTRYPQATLSCLAATYKVLENPELYPSATVTLCKGWLPANLRHAGARLVWNGETKPGRNLLLESARLELSFRTILALGASVFPGKLGRELMKARYYVSRRLGI